MRRIDEIIIHCSATEEGKDYTVEDIDKWHKARGWKGIGYHYVIYRDGTIHEGRKEEEIGAHCTDHNTHSIGICYIGGVDKFSKPKDTRTPEQKETMTKLVWSLVGKYAKMGWNVTVHPHSEYANKSCPCFNVKEWLKEIGLENEPRRH